MSVLRINETSLIALSREAVRKRHQQEPRGVIINISSMAAHYGIQKVVAYSPSKALWKV